MKPYSIAKEELRELEDESRYLRSNLTAAIESGDPEEITRLKCRERDLPNELFTAKVLVMKARLSDLEAQQGVNYQKLLEAKSESKECDALAIIQVKTLKDEIGRLTNLTYTKLNAIKIAEREIGDTSRAISQAREELDKLLN